MNKNNRLLDISIRAAMTVALFAAINSASAATNFEKPCRNSDYVRNQVEEVLGENLPQFEPHVQKNKA